MNYISVCSGIEAATVAWHPLGWKAVAYSEIEPFPSAVLAHHYPDVQNVGDMTKFKEWDFGNQAIELLVGGTPCQSFSVAGLRKGLEDPRGNLALTYCGILDKFRPKWFVWENVPGVLSSNGGRDFGSFLGALAELGYGFAYRVLDAQYVGGARAVPQRRRRVFVVGCLGNWKPAAEVLFESKSLRRNIKTSRKQGKEVAGTIAARFGISRNNHEECVATFDRQSSGISSGKNPNTIATLCATDSTKWGSNQWVNEGKAILQPIAIAENIIGRQPHNGSNGNGYAENSPMYTLNATGVHGVAQPMFVDTYNGTIQGDVAVTMTADMAGPTHTGPKIMQQIVAPTLTATNDPSRSPQSTEVTNQIAAVHAASMAVRRLTPIECERLQGFPDNYTNISWRKSNESPDGLRYKALGNSMAVPVMAWIGERIEMVNNKLNNEV
jgi:DNA (cytosine-5)-methyltransferase 1